MAVNGVPGGQILVAPHSFPIVAESRTRFSLIRLHGNGTIDTGFGGNGWRTCVVSDPTGQGQTAPYSQLHTMVCSGAGATMFGRTFFEGNSQHNDFVTLLRVRFERLFADAFEF